MERADQTDHVIGEWRGRGLADDPAVDVVVGQIEQLFERQGLVVGQRMGAAVRERAQNQVRFSKPTPPGAEPQPLQPRLIHAEAPDIGQEHARGQWPDGHSPNVLPGVIGARRIRRLSSTPAVRCLTCWRYSGSVTMARKAPALGYSAMKAKSQRSSDGPVTTVCGLPAQTWRAPTRENTAAEVRAYRR